MNEDMTIGEYLKSLPDDQINGALDRIAAIITDDLEGAFSFDGIYAAVSAGEYDECMAQDLLGGRL